ncbi:NAD(P)-binding protein [Neurospora crassa]|uniref:Short chain dehydrogenase/reductase SDR n=1 Tax=Neurospora crassa (strain ATCC 24698 / 74-OR23-1A / CBS 708.71 / DSM 1257 / FGSC 987) TaxID=367110 RepID=Q7S8G9_NEUCR|nr:short chain dehydrogenase/reductase SDR [Neurospora crassa OR74A]EAA32632.1 short chain dehydrogenase/reductase SDR [Neurospora crassa OR74A]KHE79067.1 NAD(P)-binding protein [Neurospora crassa]|eukprot:XP_961868.1 short chain dehydrogenase/reductase SDR [Neurospora crassa OR74A]
MPTYVVTGSNRGIGLEIVRQLTQSPDNTVLALVRNLSKDHSSLKSLASEKTHILECDTSSLSSIRDFAKTARSTLGDTKIDYVINNAGVNLSEQNSSLQLAPDDLLDTIKTNVLGPAKLLEFLLQQGLLSENVRVQNMSSTLGSVQMTLSGLGRATAYSISKAALNMLNAHLATDLRKAGLKGAVVIVMCPGWVKTDMGGDGAMLSPEESVAGQLKVVHGLKDEDNGKFFNYRGENVPW